MDRMTELIKRSDEGVSSCAPFGLCGARISPELKFSDQSPELAYLFVGEDGDSIINACWPLVSILEFHRKANMLIASRTDVIQDQVTIGKVNVHGIFDPGSRVSPGFDPESVFYPFLFLSRCQRV
jgi:hypothetical protein